ncbi:hypothetical protein PoB_005871500 [Plakobranchus ocellatus]|uniref:Uncharacterized protein n=1 Tax=Plakobranchus ocellatus TaxID=259542 RepID=A0AAV4CK29_9GAST|nr:hypothetical protein PoB_005871500 [Plakobranchus ocellatus]
MVVEIKDDLLETPVDDDIDDFDDNDDNYDGEGYTDNAAAADNDDDMIVKILTVNGREADPASRGRPYAQRETLRPEGDPTPRGRPYVPRDPMSRGRPNVPRETQS